MELNERVEEYLTVLSTGGNLQRLDAYSNRTTKDSKDYRTLPRLRASSCPLAQMVADHFHTVTDVLVSGTDVVLYTPTAKQEQPFIPAIRVKLPSRLRRYVVKLDSKWMYGKTWPVMYPLMLINDWWDRKR